MTSSSSAPGFVIGHDVGTGGSKSVLADTGGNILARRFEPYAVSYPKPRWAEQNPEDWWRAVTKSTRSMIDEIGADPGRALGIGFAGQAIGVVPVDASGEPLRAAIIWLDSRADEQAERITRRLGGRRVVLAVAGAVPSGKDVICKLAWIREKEPDVFRDTRFFLDVTGYLVYRCTGNMVMDHTAAGATGLLDNKKREWSPLLAALTRTPLDKMAPLARCIDVAGGLTSSAARDMGLAEGTPVIAGMADIPGAATGSGALLDGDSHINLGTSSWLCLSVSRSRNLGKNGVFPIVSPDPGMITMVGESETAGMCLKWFAEQFARPEERERAAGEMAIFKVLDEVASEVEPGSGGLLFTPWMFGERSPVTDTTLRASFANLGLNHGRDHMLRSVYEGVAYNLRWLLDVVGDAGWPCVTVRAIGGGAASDLWMQVIADVTGRRIDAMENPQEAGAVGCALAVAVARGVLGDYKDIKKVLRVRRSFEPDASNAVTYGELYGAFRGLYPALSKLGRLLNEVRG